VVRPHVGPSRRAAGAERHHRLAPRAHQDGRFGKWLEHNVDWALSRDRYWGTPLPLWRCEGGHDTCIGSVAELSDRAGRDLSGLELHRPFVDDITFPCTADGCGAMATRLPPVLDAWFDSGAMPSAQHHHPFAGDEAFSSAFPADFICEAVDQTRGWFYSLLAVNTLVFDASPYRNVVCLGLIVDADGQKMSKSKGNVLDPWHVFDTQGADALRWYFFSAGQPWTARRVYEDGIRESTRQSLLTLWNVFSFFATYADLDGGSPKPGGRPSSPPPCRPPPCSTGGSLGRGRRTPARSPTPSRASNGQRANRIARLNPTTCRNVRRPQPPRFWRSRDPSPQRNAAPCLVRTSPVLAPFTPFLGRTSCGGRSPTSCRCTAATGRSRPARARRRAPPRGGRSNGGTLPRSPRAGGPHRDAKVRTASPSGEPSCSTPAWSCRRRSGPRSPRS
jgi:isoleucyl-tRNA synthetase